MPVSGKELLQELLHPTRKAMEKNGVTVEFLIEKGKKLLKAEKTTYQKVKGEPEENQDSKTVAKTESEAVIAINSDDLVIQQRQEDMFFRLGGHYPSEKVDHSVNLAPQLSEEEAKLAKEAVDYVLKRALLGGNDEK